MVAREISEQITLYTSKKCTPIYTNPRDFFARSAVLYAVLQVVKFFRVFLIQLVWSRYLM